MRHENLRHQVGVLLEEAGVVLQVFGDVVGNSALIVRFLR
jgi:hypothetical protein